LSEESPGKTAADLVDVRVWPGWIKRQRDGLLANLFGDGEVGRLEAEALTLQRQEINRPVFDDAFQVGGTQGSQRTGMDGQPKIYLFWRTEAANFGDRGGTDLNTY
jgi:hypothetical protein